MESQAALGEESVGGIVLKGSESLGRKAEGKNNGNKHRKDKAEEWKVISSSQCVYYALHKSCLASTQYTLEPHTLRGRGA